MKSILTITYIIVIPSIVLLLSSCDPTLQVEYEVENNSKSNWIIYYGSAHLNGTSIQGIELNPNESKTLLSYMELGTYEQFIKKKVGSQFDTLSFTLNNRLYTLDDTAQIRTVIENESNKIIVFIHLTDSQKMHGFNGYGYCKLYNKNRQLSKVGTFNDYNLINGLLYTYNESDSLVNVKLLKNGNIINNSISLDSIEFYFPSNNDEDSLNNNYTLSCGTPYKIQ